MTVKIISGDAVFARMLRLELERRGSREYALSVLECPEPNKAGSADIFVVDADFIDRAQADLLAQNGKCAIFFTGNNCEPPQYIKNHRCFFRPFIVSEFCCQVFESVSELQKEEAKKAGPPSMRKSPERRAELILSGDGKVFFDGKTVILTKREYELLEYLYKKRGKPVSRDEAVTAVWNYEFTGNTNIVDVYIRYLRRKLDEKLGVKLIYTVRGKGYMLKL